MLNNMEFWVSDVPCSSLEDDSLGIKDYVKGLEKFVMCCPTPMSIALQGDWGTGKTSFLQAMKNDFEKEKDTIKTIYFNTWQYSQFRMSEDLYASFINNIVSALGEETGMKELTKEVMQNVFKVSSFFAKKIIKDVTSIDIADLEKELLNKEIERVKMVSSLKEQFAQMVEKAKGPNGRVVIFVDDLDRLNPEIAVELLEVMKLFMDVPNCVFILAIDYEVVVNGVRKKLGNDMSEEKCRSFFDKIIQLPFRMPVASYRIEKMLRTILKGVVEEYIEPICLLIKNTLGANPRTLKRLSNSFFLLRIVEQQSHGNQQEQGPSDECKAALLYCSLVIQMHCYEAYEKLLECETGQDILEIFESSKENSADETNTPEDMKAEKIRNALLSLSLAIEKITEKYKKQRGDGDIYEKLLQTLKLSSITTVSSSSPTGQQERSEAMKVSRIYLEGKSLAVKNPTDAIVETYQYILEKNSSKIEDFMKAYPRILTTDPNAVKGYYRKKKELNILLDNQPLYIGTSSGSMDKLLYTRYLCDFMGIESGQIIWYDKEEKVFSN